jgi:sec-independent protein translocase protein TatB
MFDFGFSKLLLLGIVALVVIGPERLPRVARTLGHLYGRLQRYVTQVKADIHREIEAAELGKVKTEFENAARSFQNEIESKAGEVEREFREVQASFDSPPAVPPPDPASPAPDAHPAPQLELGIEDTSLPSEPRAKAGG